MAHSLPWEPKTYSASQEIPRLLWNPKVHYRVHKSPPFLSQAQLLLRLPSRLFPSGFVFTSHLFHACYTPHPSRPRFYHPNNIRCSVQVMKLLIMQSSPAPGHFLLDPNILLSTLFSNTLTLCFSLKMACIPFNITQYCQSIFVSK